MEYEAEHLEVVERIADGRLITPAPEYGRGKYMIDDLLVHVRFAPDAQRDGVTYLFSFYPNSFDADFEILICGTPGHYYLVPAAEIAWIYEHPDAYRDRKNRSARVANMNTKQDRLMYARGARTLDCQDYFNGWLVDDDASYR